MKRIVFCVLILFSFSLWTLALAKDDEFRAIKRIKDLSHQSGKLGTYRALIIGINDYQDPKIQDLKTALGDARAMAKVLRERYAFQVKLLLDRKATREAIFQSLRKLALSTKPDDSVLVYYAGHGDLDRIYKDGWWIPADAKARKPVTYLGNAQVQMAMRSMRARHVLLISDSCYSGTLFGQGRSLPSEITDKYYLSLYNEKSRWGMTSGNKTPVSDRGTKGHSVFAYQLLKVLSRNEKPYLSTQEIYTRIAPIVSNNSEQTPLCRPIKNTGDQGGEFVFVASLKTPSTRPAGGISGKPPKPAGGLGDYDKLIQEREASKGEWLKWQERMEADFEKAQKYEQKAVLNNKEKAGVWKSFLASYSADNPFEKKDDELREKARERRQHWGKEPVDVPEKKKGALYVETEPKVASVKILNIKPRFSQGMELAPGKYHIEVSSKGFETKTKWIELVPGKEKRVIVKLVEGVNTGKIRITGTPKSAKVFLNKQFVGKIPLVLEKINSGSHNLEVTSKGYKAEKRQIKLAGKLEATIKIDLEKLIKTGHLSISGSPRGAKVYVDGEYAGELPLDLQDIEEGDHKVKVVTKRHKTFEKFVSLSPNDHKKLDVSLKPYISLEEAKKHGVVSPPTNKLYVGLKWVDKIKHIGESESRFITKEVVSEDDEKYTIKVSIPSIDSDPVYNYEYKDGRLHKVTSSVPLEYVSWKSNGYLWPPHKLRMGDVWDYSFESSAKISDSLHITKGTSNNRVIGFEHYMGRDCIVIEMNSTLFTDYKGKREENESRDIYYIDYNEGIYVYFKNRYAIHSLVKIEHPEQ